MGGFIFLFLFFESLAVPCQFVQNFVCSLRLDPDGFAGVRQFELPIRFSRSSFRVIAAVGNWEQPMVNGLHLAVWRRFEEAKES